MTVDPPISARVTRIKVIAQLFFRGSDGGPDSVATDILADLQHWCAENNVRFDDALNRARGHYLFERARGSGTH